MIEILRVFNIGKEKCDCEHDFIYDDKAKSTFTMPPKHFRERICSKCGRLEYIQEEDYSFSNGEEFRKLKEKFELK